MNKSPIAPIVEQSGLVVNAVEWLGCVPHCFGLATFFRPVTVTSVVNSETLPKGWGASHKSGENGRFSRACLKGTKE